MQVVMYVSTSSTKPVRTDLSRYSDRNFTSLRNQCHCHRLDRACWKKTLAQHKLLPHDVLRISCAPTWPTPPSQSRSPVFHPRAVHRPGFSAVPPSSPHPYPSAPVSSHPLSTNR